MSTPYTYLIRHKETGKMYHGSRTSKKANPGELLKENGYLTSSRIVKNIIKEGGLDSFEIVNIEIFNTPDEARLAEELYHKEYDVEGNVCYFNRHNAGGKFHFTQHTDEGRKRISESHKGNNYKLGKKESVETRKKKSLARQGEKNPNYGKKASEETRRKNSEGQKGKIISEEHKQKLRDWNKLHGGSFLGKNHSEETKKKISEKAKGRKDTEETKKKKSAASTGRFHTDETKKKLSAIHKGKSKSLETKRKLSDSAKNQPKIECPYCYKEGSPSNMKRWHFDNCKSKLKEVA